jgi:hypothetical protein
MSMAHYGYAAVSAVLVRTEEAYPRHRVDSAGPERASEEAQGHS